MAKKRDDLEISPVEPDAPGPEAVPPPPPAERGAPAGGWKRAVLFVCVKCGKTVRSQEHLAMVCRACSTAT